MKDDWERTGYPGLAAAVRALGLQSGKGLCVDYVVGIRSYLPSLIRQFLLPVYSVIHGDVGLFMMHEMS